nr:unnamed protein product [Digitaria exilis]
MRGDPIIIPWMAAVVARDDPMDGSCPGANSDTQQLDGVEVAMQRVHELYNNCPSIASLTSAELSPSSWIGNASNSNHVALAPFGLATYKLDAKVWASPNSGDQKHIACLYDAAQSWLKKHGIYHYDFNFFSASCSSTRT